LGQAAWKRVGGLNPASEPCPGWLCLSKQTRTGLHYRNQLRRKMTLAKSK
jgi:hypothetical protein